MSVTAVQGEADDYRTVLLDCVAGRNWVLTSHQEPVEFLEDFDDRFRGESNVGQFGSAGFLSALLTEQLLTYSRQLEPTVKEIDHLEQLVLRDRVDEGKLLRQLVAITQRIARLRRWLTPHREIYERLAQPNISQLLPTLPLKSCSQRLSIASTARSTTWTRPARWQPAQSTSTPHS